LYWFLRTAITFGRQKRGGGGGGGGAGKVDASLNHSLIIQLFKVYRLEGKWVLGHAVFGGVVHHGISRNFSLGCRIDEQV
jgi:hypothetical protein